MGKLDIRKPTIIPQGSPPDRQTPQSGVRPSGLSFRLVKKPNQSPRQDYVERGRKYRSPNPQASKMAPELKNKKKMLSKAAARTVNSDCALPNCAL